MILVKHMACRLERSGRALGAHEVLQGEPLDVDEMPARVNWRGESTDGARSARRRSRNADKRAWRQPAGASPRTRDSLRFGRGNSASPTGSFERRTAVVVANLQVRADAAISSAHDLDVAAQRGVATGVKPSPPRVLTSKPSFSISSSARRLCENAACDDLRAGRRPPAPSAGPGSPPAP